MFKESSVSTVRGRQAVPTEVANAIQMLLTEMMADKEMDDNLMMAWLDRYGADPKEGGFNAFAEFCNTHADDDDLMSRIITGQYTEEDLKAIQSFAEKHPDGGKFVYAEPIESEVAS